MALIQADHCFAIIIIDMEPLAEAKPQASPSLDPVPWQALYGPGSSQGDSTLTSAKYEHLKAVGGR